MSQFEQKDSQYSIEPWCEEPSKIPNEFLASHTFAKTAFRQKPQLKEAPNL